MKLSELREELTGIEAAENPGRVKEIRAAIAEQEKQYRGQVEAEGKDKEPSAEEKEFAALRNGLSIRNYIRAAAGEARLSDKGTRIQPGARDSGESISPGCPCFGWGCRYDDAGKYGSKTRNFNYRAGLRVERGRDSAA